MNSRFGEMQDLISCLAVYEDNAEIAEKKKPKTFDEVMEML